MIWLKQKSVLQQMNITLAALKNELDYTFHHSRLTLNKINAINIERVLSTHNIKNWRKREKELAQQVNIKSSHYNSQSEKCVIQQEKVSQCSQLTLKYEKKMEKIKIMLVTINNNSHF
ncbi:hypothetical protein EB241_00900 [Erwinia psidii]|uniref:Uncharacterized protein n=2 Tax=Erwinia psidii TaxID=69224 RepID=A0A3N6SIY3_9GAMM|nr:hypothetical protein EB241_00900 [Erwinia psidii]